MYRSATLCTFQFQLVFKYVLLFADFSFSECVIFHIRTWPPNRTRLTARAISRAPKKSRVPGPTPLVMKKIRLKNYARGRKIYRYINS